MRRAVDAADVVMSGWPSSMGERAAVTSRWLAVVILALLVGGCAARLRPGPAATVVPGRGHGAEATEAGVRVVARADAWRARPAQLEAVVTPVLVTIENGGSRPLRISQADFALVSDVGRRFAAVPPFEIEGSMSEPLPSYGFPRWRPAPRLLGFHRGRAVYVFDPFWYDPTWYDPFYPSGFVHIDLPTADMVQLALRETPLEPTASTTGFVYFQRVPGDVGHLNFTLRLVDARTGDPFGTIFIPFVVE
jgi:hypothetical protein